MSCQPGEPDLVLQYWQADDVVVPAVGCQWGQESVSGDSWVVLPGIARIRTGKSSRVTIEAESEVSAKTLQAVAGSTALPLALQRLKGLVLESSAVCWGEGALLLVGKGICGKSTLAALLSDIGAPLLADSHSFVQAEGSGFAKMSPALPHVRLWASQAEFLTGSWPASCALRPGNEKRLYVVPQRFARVPTKIKGLVFLRRGVDENFTIRRLGLNEALQSLALASDRLRPTLSREMQVSQFRIMSTLASLPVCHLLQWPRGEGRVIETRDRLIEFIRDKGWGDPA
jgi:hypothetical protein